jgi:hypothetical protein
VLGVWCLLCLVESVCCARCMVFGVRAESVCCELYGVWCAGGQRSCLDGECLLRTGGVVDVGAVVGRCCGRWSSGRSV